MNARICVYEEQDLLEAIPLMARLASLGDRSLLDTWIEKSGHIKYSVEDLLIARVKEGLWDIDHMLGEELGLALIDAQDFHCFFRHEKARLAEPLHSWFEAWKEEANAVGINEDTKRVIEGYLEEFPLPEADRLAIFSGPVTLREWERRAAGVCTDNSSVIVSRHPAAVEWLKKQVGVGIPVLASATADDVRDKVVYGNLPLTLAAEAKRVLAICFTGDPPRGAEYTLEDMEKAGAYLKSFTVYETQALRKLVASESTDATGIAIAGLQLPWLPPVR